jgi:hypothetical protein
MAIFALHNAIPRPHPKQLKGWMRFRGSPFVCPAKSEFSPRMISILVASLVEAFPDAKFELQQGGPRGRMDIAVFHRPCTPRGTHIRSYHWK